MRENELTPMGGPATMVPLSIRNTLINNGDGVQVETNNGTINVSVNVQGQTWSNVGASHAMEWAALSRDYYCLFVLEDELYNRGVIYVSKDHALQEYTPRNVLEKFRSLSLQNINDLKKMPCIFAKKSERGGQSSAIFLVGTIQDIAPQGDNIRISFNIFQPFSQNLLEQNRKMLHIASARMRSELCIEHWAIKHCDLIAAFDQMHLQIA